MAASVREVISYIARFRDEALPEQRGVEQPPRLDLSLPVFMPTQTSASREQP
jgi:hypothetical protein